MKRLILALPVFVLAACGGADTTTGATAAEDAAPVITTVNDVRDRLAGTEYECVEWEMKGEDAANCWAADPNGREGVKHSRQSVRLVNDGELFAAMLLDSDVRASGVVWGEGWSVVCHPRVGVAGCGDIAEILGGSVMTR